MTKPTATQSTATDSATDSSAPGRDELTELLAPVIELVRTLDPGDPTSAAQLSAAFPVDGPELTAVATLLRRAVAAGTVCDREAGGVRFSRVTKANDPRTSPLSIDAVHMTGPGPGHTHPGGEFDLCFAVNGEPTFDGQPPGWTVYPPGSWHVPTVSGGAMDILYFLPEGAIRFEPRPE